MTVEIDVESIGHDLAWGTSQFSRSVHTDPPSSTPTLRREQEEKRDSDGFFPAGDGDSGLLPQTPVLDSSRS